MRTLLQLFNEANDIIRTTQTTSVDNDKRINAFKWVVRDINSDAHFLYTVRHKRINVYAGRATYRLSSELSIADFKDFYDIVPSPYRKFDKVEAREFNSVANLQPGRNVVSHTFQGTNKVILYNDGNQGTLLLQASGLTDSGATWAVVSASDAVNLTADTVEFKEHSGSLNFDLDVSNSVNDYAEVELDGFTNKDLSDLENKAEFRMWVYIPDVTNMTSVTLFVGSSSSAYWSLAVTTDYLGNSLTTGWNWLTFKWEDMTATSSPDASALTYAKVRLTYDNAQADDTDFRINDITYGKRINLEIQYYSSYSVLDSSDAWKNIATITSDQCLSPDEGIAPFVSGIAWRTMRMLKGDTDSSVSEIARIYKTDKQNHIQQYGEDIRRANRRQDVVI